MLRKGADYPTDMSDLATALGAAGIPYELRPHPASLDRGMAGHRAKDIIGYNPAGDWQIIIDGKYSVIRGMASFGLYELMQIHGEPDERGWSEDPERFGTPSELIKAVQEAQI